MDAAPWWDKAGGSWAEYIFVSFMPAHISLFLMWYCLRSTGYGSFVLGIFLSHLCLIIHVFFIALSLVVDWLCSVVVARYYPGGGGFTIYSYIFHN